MDRRTALTTISAVGTAIMSGCTSFPNGTDGAKSKEKEIEITVRNDSQKSITMDVFFTTTDRMTIFSTRYQLDPESANERHEFRGNPEYIYVVVNGSMVEISEFNSKKCKQAESISAGIVYNAQGNIGVGFSCRG